MAMSILRSIVLLLCIFAVPAFAQEMSEQSGIVAVVNDGVISTRDLNNRMALALTSTRLSDTQETRERIRPQLLRALIDEILQSQDAARNGIAVSETEVTQAVTGLETERNMQPGSLLPWLEAHGVPKESLTSEIRAQIAWTKLVVKKLRPNVRVSEDEVARERSKLQNDDGSTSEVQIEILPLPIDKPSNEPQIKALAEKLVAEIRGGAPFESVARALGGAAAENSAQPFWVAEAQLDPGIAAALKGAANNTVTDPVRTQAGYTIARLMARRGLASVGSPTLTEVVLKDIVLKLPTNAEAKDAQTALTIGNQLAQHPGNCSDSTVADIQNISDYNIVVQFRRDRLDALPETLRDIVNHLNLGDVSSPYATSEGVHLFMLCERVETPVPLVGHDETQQRLYRQKMELEAEKYLRRLRREATIEIRDAENNATN